MTIGDLYHNYGYPFVGAAHGGSFKGMVQAIDLVKMFSNSETKLISGHGGIITQADLPACRQMIVAVAAQVQSMIADGHSLNQVLAAKLTTPYDVKVRGGLDPLPAGLGTSAERFVSALFAEKKRTDELKKRSHLKAGMRRRNALIWRSSFNGRDGLPPPEGEAQPISSLMPPAGTAFKKPFSR